MTTQEYYHQYYLAHKLAAKEYQDKYRASHRLAIKETQHKYYLAHKTEHAKYGRLWNLNHKARALELSRNAKWKQRYNFARPNVEQDTKICGICGRERILHMDHDHKTNEFRGWLCRSCNTRLGFLETYTLEIMRYLN